MADITDLLRESIRRATASSTALAIRGNDSKAFMGRASVGKVLDVSAHAGIVDFEPTELVVVVRAGTPIADIDAALGAEGQMLVSDPPRFGGLATAGGTLATNLSGPARPWSGSFRDQLLGIVLLNGRAEKLRFGGRVMKNVAGYDVSRLQAGAFGAFGVVTELTLRTGPRPEASETRVLELDAAAAIDRMASIAGTPAPLSGACWYRGHLYLRFSGNADAVAAEAAALGGDIPEAPDAFWRELRDFELEPFASGIPVWRFSLPSATPHLLPDGDWLIDWGGAQRFLFAEAEFGGLEAMAAGQGGEIGLFKNGDRSGEVLHSRNTVERRILYALKSAFDPQGVFNPGRAWGWLGG